MIMRDGALSIVRLPEPANRSKSGSSMPLNGYVRTGIHNAGVVERRRAGNWVYF